MIFKGNQGNNGAGTGRFPAKFWMGNMSQVYYRLKSPELAQTRFFISCKDHISGKGMFNAVFPDCHSYSRLTVPLSYVTLFVYVNHSCISMGFVWNTWTLVCPFSRSGLFCCPSMWYCNTVWSISVDVDQSPVSVCSLSIHDLPHHFKWTLNPFVLEMFAFKTEISSTMTTRLHLFEIFHIWFGEKMQK